MQQAISGQAGNTGKASGLGDAQTMQRLMLAWGMMPKRQFPRRGSESRVRLVVGLAALHRDLFAESNPIPVKWAVAQLGLAPTGIRLPLTWLSEAAQPRVRKAMEQAGII